MHRKIYIKEYKYHYSFYKKEIPFWTLLNQENHFYKRNKE